MKYLNKLTLWSKAVVLHQLFPEEIPNLLTYISNICITIQEEQERNRRSWNNEHLAFDEWLVIVKDMESEIAYYRTAMSKSSYFFSDKCFNDVDACFTLYCLNLYTTTRLHPNPQFNELMQILFDKEPNPQNQAPEFITHADNHDDQWICLCGNYAEHQGFYPCNQKGDMVHPVAGAWDNLYVCMLCGRIIDQNDLQVKGYNPYPKDLEESEEN